MQYEVGKLFKSINPKEYIGINLIDNGFTCSVNFIKGNFNYIAEGVDLHVERMINQLNSGLEFRAYLTFMHDIPLAYKTVYPVPFIAIKKLFIMLEGLLNTSNPYVIVNYLIKNTSYKNPIKIGDRDSKKLLLSVFYNTNKNYSENITFALANEYTDKETNRTKHEFVYFNFPINEAILVFDHLKRIVETFEHKIYDSITLQSYSRIPVVRKVDEIYNKLEWLVSVTNKLKNEIIDLHNKLSKFDDEKKIDVNDENVNSEVIVNNTERDIKIEVNKQDNTENNNIENIEETNVEDKEDTGAAKIVADVLSKEIDSIYEELRGNQSTQLDNIPQQQQKEEEVNKTKLDEQTIQNSNILVKEHQKNVKEKEHTQPKDYKKSLLYNDESLLLYKEQFLKYLTFEFDFANDLIPITILPVKFYDLNEYSEIIKDNQKLTDYYNNAQNFLVVERILRDIILRNKYNSNSILYQLYRYIIEVKLSKILYVVLIHNYYMVYGIDLSRTNYDKNKILINLQNAYRNDAKFRGQLFTTFNKYIQTNGIKKFFNEIVLNTIISLINEFNDVINTKLFNRKDEKINEILVKLFAETTIIDNHNICDINKFADENEPIIQVNIKKFIELFKNYAQQNYNNNPEQLFISITQFETNNVIFADYYEYYSSVDKYFHTRGEINKHLLKYLSTNYSEFSNIDPIETFRTIINTIRISATFTNKVNFDELSKSVPDINKTIYETLLSDELMSFIIKEYESTIIDYINYYRMYYSEFYRRNDIIIQSKLQKYYNIFKHFISMYVPDTDKKQILLKHKPLSIQHMFAILYLFYYTSNQNEKIKLLQQLKSFLSEVYNIKVDKELKIHSIAFFNLLEKIKDKIEDICNNKHSYKYSQSGSVLLEIYSDIIRKLNIGYLFEPIYRNLIIEIILDCIYYSQ